MPKLSSSRRTFRILMLAIVFLVSFLASAPVVYATKSGWNTMALASSQTSSPPGFYSTAVSKIAISQAAFDGLSETQASCPSLPCTPPDVQLAVGPSDVMQMVNLGGRVWSKTSLSTVRLTFALSTLFGTGTDATSDPRVLYDPVSRVWFATLLDVTTDSVKLVVSSGTDPVTSTWYIYTFPAGPNCPDFPAIGINDDKVTITANDFTACSGNPTFTGVQYWVLNKSNLTSHVNVKTWVSAPDTSIFSAHPVHSFGATTTEYMVSNILVAGQISADSLRMFSITGVPGVSTVTSTTVDVPIATITGLPSITVGGHTYSVAPEAGVSCSSLTSCVNLNDVRVLDSAWSGGKVWLTFHEGCTPPGDSALRSCVRVSEIDPTSSSTVEDVDIYTRGKYLFYPALSIDGLNNLVLIYGYSSATDYPGIAITGQGPRDQAGFLATPVTLSLSGATNDNSGRYGDYFGAAPDPSDAGLVWVAGEYVNSAAGNCAGTHCWSTSLASVREQDFTVTANPASVQMPPDSSATVTYTFASQNGYAGPIVTIGLSRAGPDVPYINQIGDPTTPTIPAYGSAYYHVTYSVSDAAPPGQNTYTLGALPPYANSADRAAPININVPYGIMRPNMDQYVDLAWPIVGGTTWSSVLNDQLLAPTIPSTSTGFTYCSGSYTTAPCQGGPWGADMTLTSVPAGTTTTTLTLWAYISVTGGSSNTPNLKVTLLQQAYGGIILQINLAGNQPTGWYSVTWTPIPGWGWNDSQMNQFDLQLTSFTPYGSSAGIATVYAVYIQYS